VRRLAALAAIGTLASGCGLLLSDAPGTTLPPPIVLENPAEQLEGEVRDEVSLAPVPDAEIVLETVRPGYVVVRRADAAGRFSIGFSSLLREISATERFADAVLLGIRDESDAELVGKITVRASADGRCSPVVTLERERWSERLLLLVGDCARYGGRGALPRARP
jgi:hypothetical protein